MSIIHQQKSFVTNKWLFLLISFAYAIYGILLDKWGVFMIVYLFWFENLVRLIFLRIKANKTSVIQFDKEKPFQTDANKIEWKHKLSDIFKLRMFFNIIYFFFIIIGLGITMPFLFDNNKDILNYFVSVINTVLFRNMEFNIALIIVIAKELFETVQAKTLYNQENPLQIHTTVKGDMILHLSIILAGFFMFLVKHPFFVSLSISKEYLFIAPGIILIVLKYGAELYFTIKTKDKSVESEDLM